MRLTHVAYVTCSLLLYSYNDIHLYIKLFLYNYYSHTWLARYYCTVIIIYIYISLSLSLSLSIYIYIYIYNHLYIIIIERYLMRLTSQKRPTCIAKETYLHRKRDLLTSQKRPTCTCIAKETYLYLYRKRDLRVSQKRPTYIAKETFLYRKRDLLTSQKRPTHITKSCVWSYLLCKNF